MNIRETFLTLTKETNPYGTEEQLLKYLPKELTKEFFEEFGREIWTKIQEARKNKF